MIYCQPRISRVPLMFLVCMAVLLITSIGAPKQALALSASSDVWTTYNTSNSGLASNNVIDFAIDAAGNKWFGTYAGVSKFDGTIWTTYDSSNSGLAYNTVLSMAVDASGNKWFGNADLHNWVGGVSKFDGTTWTTYTPYNSGLSGYDVDSIEVDTSGNKWFGLYGGGVSKFDGTIWTTYNPSNSGLASYYVNDTAIDASGNKWFATSLPPAGVSKFDGTTWTTYNTSNSGLADNYVLRIATDVSGNMWFGTYGAGVSKFDGTTWTTYDTSNSGLADNNVLSIATDVSGNKWFGTWGAGVSKFDGTTWTTYNSSNSGLASNRVDRIVVDFYGNKWFGTDLGVSVLGGNPPSNHGTHPNGMLIKTASNDCVYYLEAGRRRAITCWSAFVSHGFRGDRIVTVSDTEVAGYPVGDILQVRQGAVVKASWPGVYLIDYRDGVQYRRPIASAAAFVALGLHWEDIISVPDSELNSYTDDPLGPLVDASRHPNGMLVKDIYSDCVYFLDNGSRRPITSWSSFISWGFRGDRIVTIPESELTMYPVGNLMPVRTGYLVKGSAPAVYVCDLINGVQYKRLVTSAATFVALGFHWEDILTISDDELNTLYTQGDAI